MLARYLTIFSWSLMVLLAVIITCAAACWLMRISYMMFITRLQNLWWSMVYNENQVTDPLLEHGHVKDKVVTNVQPTTHHVNLGAWRPTFLLLQLLPLPLSSLLLLLSLVHCRVRTSCLYPRTRLCIYYYNLMYSKDRNCFGIMLFCAIKLLIMLTLK